MLIDICAVVGCITIGGSLGAGAFFALDLTISWFCFGGIEEAKREA